MERESERFAWNKKKLGFHKMLRPEGKHATFEYRIRISEKNSTTKRLSRK